MLELCLLGRGTVAMRLHESPYDRVDIVIGDEVISTERVGRLTLDLVWSRHNAAPVEDWGKCIEPTISHVAKRFCTEGNDGKPRREFFVVGIEGNRVYAVDPSFAMWWDIPNEPLNYSL